MDRIVMRCMLALLTLPWCAMAAEFHDPTRPAAAFMPGASSAPAVEVQAAYVLEAVQRSPKQATALINGQRVSVGQRVGAYRLESLTADTAVLSGPEGRRVLRIAESVKRPVPNNRSPAAATGKPVVQGEQKR